MKTRPHRIALTIGLIVASFSLLFGSSAYAENELWVSGNHMGNSSTGLPGFMRILTDQDNTQLGAPLSFFMNVADLKSVGVSRDSSRIVAIPQYDPRGSIYSNYNIDTIDTGNGYMGSGQAMSSGTEVVFGKTGLINQFYYVAYNQTNLQNIPNLSRVDIGGDLNIVTSVNIEIPVQSTHLTVNALGTLVYVNGEGLLMKIQGQNDLLEDTSHPIIATTTSSGTDLSLSLDESRLFIVDPDNDRVDIYSTSDDLSYLGSIPVGDRPTIIERNPATGFFYVLNKGSSTISVIGTSTDEVIHEITLPSGTEPTDMTFSVRGENFYVLDSKIDGDGSTRVHSYRTSDDAFVETIDMPGVNFSKSILALDHSYTPAGQEAKVTPATGVWITFQNVSSPGVTVSSSTNVDPGLPFNSRILDATLYFDLTTTASWTGTTSICLHYNSGDMTSDHGEDLRFMHKENGSWVDRTVSIDFQNEIICGEVTSFSPMAVVETNAEAFTEIETDIRPNTDSDKINLLSNGSIPIGIFGSDTFSVNDIDLDTVAFEGAPIEQRANGSYKIQFKDINKDHKMDIVARFDIQSMNVTPIDDHAVLWGRLNDESLFMGRSHVVVLHDPNDPEGE